MGAWKQTLMQSKHRKDTREQRAKQRRTYAIPLGKEKPKQRELF